MRTVISKLTEKIDAISFNYTISSGVITGTNDFHLFKKAHTVGMWDAKPIQFANWLIKNTTHELDEDGMLYYRYQNTYKPAEELYLIFLNETH